MMLAIQHSRMQPSRIFGEIHLGNLQISNNIVKIDKA
jgi:hypothetical protein